MCSLYLSSPDFLFLSTIDVKCMDLPDDINDTTFLVHPVAPAGVTLRMLDGTPDYEMAKRMILAFREALSGCDELGKYGLATYPWLSEKDHITKVSFKAKKSTFESHFGLNLKSLLITLRLVQQVS